jgi:dATP pyrophosphohydrolase
MARAPFQVLVIPFRDNALGSFDYALFQRADAAYWQGIAGGGEDAETPIAAAKREAFEEAQIPPTARYFALQAMSLIPVVSFAARHHWPNHRYVIPNYCFAVDCAALAIGLSSEHTTFRWVSYREGHALLHWDDNRTALWELNERLLHHDLPAPL